MQLDSLLYVIPAPAEALSDEGLSREAILDDDDRRRQRGARTRARGGRHVGAAHVPRQQPQRLDRPRAATSRSPRSASTDERRPLPARVRHRARRRLRAAALHAERTRRSCSASSARSCRSSSRTTSSCAASRRRRSTCRSSTWRISPQCGFASTAPGNLLTWDDQRRKLELVVSSRRGGLGDPERSAYSGHELDHRSWARRAADDLRRGGSATAAGDHRRGAPCEHAAPAGGDRAAPRRQHHPGARGARGAAARGTRAAAPAARGRRLPPLGRGSPRALRDPHRARGARGREGGRPVRAGVGGAARGAARRDAHGPAGRALPRPQPAVPLRAVRAVGSRAPRGDDRRAARRVERLPEHLPGDRRLPGRGARRGAPRDPRACVARTPRAASRAVRDHLQRTVEHRPSRLEAAERSNHPAPRRRIRWLASRRRTSGA